MLLEFVVLILSVVATAFAVWIVASKYYQNSIDSLKEENLNLKSRAGINENLVNEVKLAFSQIAQESLKNQQEALLAEHSKDLKSKMELFKAEEITPVNRLLKEFKDTIDNYQKAHESESLEIKNAISIAEKYARALTMNQNSKGEFGEDWLEQIFKFANLQENIHYTKQYSSGSVKPDFVVYLPDDKHIVIDSKVILKNFIEYRQSDNDETLKKAFLTDLNNCITILSKKNYEEIEGLTQPGFIIMYIPIESCINLIYTDFDFRKIIETANSRNIIIAGTSSLLVTLRLVNQLWASQMQYDNVQNIITVGQNLYNNIATHAQNLLNIKQAIEKSLLSINTELNRFTARNNGSIFKEAEKLRQYGITSKELKTGKRLVENIIPQELLNETSDESQMEVQ